MRAFRLVIFSSIVQISRAWWGFSSTTALSPAPRSDTHSGVLGKRRESMIVYQGALVELETMRDKLIGDESSCHINTLNDIQKLTETSPSGLQTTCGNDCTKLKLTLSLSNCILGLTSHVLIKCNVENFSGKCSLRKHCLTQSPRSSMMTTAAALSSLLLSTSQQDQEGASFDIPTQQSIVWSQSYQYIDKLCCHLNHVIAINNSVAMQRLLSSSIQNIAIMAQNAADASLGTIEAIHMLRDHEFPELSRVAKNSVDISSRALGVAESSLSMQQDNLAATRELESILIIQHHLLSNVSKQMDIANVKLNASINMQQHLVALTNKGFASTMAVLRCLEKAHEIANGLFRTMLMLLIISFVVIMIRGPVYWIIYLIWVVIRCLAWLYRKRGCTMGLDECNFIDDEYTATSEVQVQEYQPFSTNDMGEIEEQHRSEDDSRRAEPRNDDLSKDDSCTIDTTPEESATFSSSSWPAAGSLSEVVNLLREIRVTQNNQRQFREASFRAALKAAERECGHIQQQWVAESKVEVCSRKRLLSEIKKQSSELQSIRMMITKDNLLLGNQKEKKTAKGRLGNPIPERADKTSQSKNKKRHRKK